MPPVSNRQDSRRRAERAHQLRAIGRTWQEIADVLGYRTRQGAMHAVARLVDRSVPETPEQLRRHEAEELRLRRAALHERFADARQRKDNDALVSLNRELDRVATRWSKLHGLDAPERTEVEVNVTQTPAAIVERMRTELLAVAAQRQPQQALTANVIEGEVIG